MDTISDLKLVVIFSRLGPYHLARLEATGRMAQTNGYRLYGIEASCSGGDYAWDKTTSMNQFFERITLFPERNYHELKRSEISSAIWDALNRIDPAVVAIPGWSFPEAVAALHWCHRMKRRAICMSDSKFDDMPRLWWKEWIKKFFFVSRFDASLVAGQPHTRYIQGLGLPTERIFLGYDVVDNHYFIQHSRDIKKKLSFWRQKLDLPERFFLLMTRFIAKKNLARLLDSYALYRNTAIAPWDLVIAGGGELEQELRSKAVQLRLQGLHWPGFIQYPDQPSYYALASAYILPSTSEQWGLVVNEAMASGLPVLVSRTAGCRYDLVEDGGNGFLFDPFSVDEIADAMRRISELSDEARAAMGQRSQEIIAEWGPDRFAEGMMQAVKKAMESPLPQRSLSLLDKAVFTILTRKG